MDNDEGEPSPWLSTRSLEEITQKQQSLQASGSVWAAWERDPNWQSTNIFFVGGFEIANQKGSAYLHNQKSTTNGYMDLFENRSRVDI